VKKAIDFNDAESYFRAQQQQEIAHTVDADMVELLFLYRHAAYRRMWVDDYSGMAEDILKRIDMLSKKEVFWNEQSPRTKRQIRMVLRWLKRCTCMSYDYEDTMIPYWEDVAALLYLSFHPGVQSRFYMLTEEIWL
jgi:hypothetical protein